MRFEPVSMATTRRPVVTYASAMSADRVVLPTPPLGYRRQHQGMGLFCFIRGRCTTSDLA